MNRRHDPESDSLAPLSSLPEAYEANGDADPLSDVLRSVRLTSALFFLWDASWPFSMPVPNGRHFAPIVLPGAQQVISYHIVREGTCWGAVEDEPPVELHSGDILLIPHGDAYTMASTEAACIDSILDLEASLGFYRQMAAGELPFVIAEGGGGPETTHVVCGFLGCDLRPFNPLLAALPRILRLNGVTSSTHQRLRTLIDLAVAEAQEPRPGSQSILVRLSELLFVELVRRCLTELPAKNNSWLAGLRDPTVGKALMLLHRRPAHSWTLERLAREVGLSRSRLAECFSDTVGEPPMQYLAQWRMQIAARLLADSTAKVATVARDVGYESEAAFSRAFKRLVGVPPAQWRRQTS